jgi:hypothetical protein
VEEIKEENQVFKIMNKKDIIIIATVLAVTLLTLVSILVNTSLL